MADNSQHLYKGNSVLDDLKLFQQEKDLEGSAHYVFNMEIS